MAEQLAGVVPAGPHAEVKRRIAAAVDAAGEEILELSHRIHAHPEPAFEETKASGWVAETLARHGFAVEHPAGSLPTAVRAVLRGGRAASPGGASGRVASGARTDDALDSVEAHPHPRIAVLAEYDALPGLGHGCGHNTMAASGVGAAIALAAVADSLPGEIVFFGTPAEERGSGKRLMIDEGLFEGIDAALLYHPCDRTHVEIHPLASIDIDVVFTGRQSHAAADPWLGRNALDAMVVLLTSIGLWRQQLKPDARVHGVVLEGGTAANVIPDRTVGRFMVRSADMEYFAAMQARFRDLCEAAALATATSVDVRFSGSSMTMKTNETIAARWVENARAYGLEDEGPDPHSGSTDMADVSWVCPAIHPDLSISDAPVAGHSTAFRDAAASPKADRTTLLAATLVAQTAADLFLEPELLERAWHEFRGEAAAGRG
jgi:amidohydrolase